MGKKTVRGAWLLFDQNLADRFAISLLAKTQSTQGRGAEFDGATANQTVLRLGTQVRLGGALSLEARELEHFPLNVGQTAYPA